jgi:rhodanese-related sulfurtransferase
MGLENTFTKRNEFMAFLKTTLLIFVSLMWITTANAAPIIQSAPAVAERLNAGEMVLLDIRSKGEWEETGLAKGAWPVSMHTSDFVMKLEQILMLYKPEQIAIICATGGRTSYIANALKQNGIDGITDISEGMIGNKHGPGWLARKMPVISLKEAQADFDAKFTTSR